MTKVLQRPTLVLNRNWQAINVATVARTLIMLWNESAKVVDPLGLHQVDDVGGAFWHADDDVLRFADDASHRWSAIDEAEGIGRFKVEREIDVAPSDTESVVNGLQHHIAKEALKQSIKLLEDVAEEQEE